MKMRIRRTTSRSRPSRPPRSRRRRPKRNGITDGRIQGRPERVTACAVDSCGPGGPTTGIFIASVSYGRKIRDVILLTVGGCASVGIIMTSITAGSTIYTQVNGIEDLVTAVNEYGIGAVPYAVLETLAGSKIIIAVIFVVIILTLVTAVNSNIIAMSGLSCKEANSKDGSDITPWYVKLAWGVVVAMMAYIAMARFGGYDGIKTLSNIGGILALFLILGMCVSLGILIVKYKKFDVLHEDGEEDEPLPAPAEAAETRTEV